MVISRTGEYMKSLRISEEKEGGKGRQWANMSQYGREVQKQKISRWRNEDVIGFSTCSWRFFMLWILFSSPASIQLAPTSSLLG